jgi:hypothetical protein
MSAKQKPSQRKALRGTKKGNSSLRRKTPPHPSPAALRKLGAAERLWVLRDDLHRASLAAPNHELFKRYGAWGSRLAMALIDLRIASGTRPTNEMGAERAHASEPVQSPAQQIASRLNSENLKPRPEPDSSILDRLKAWARKMMGR